MSHSHYMPAVDSNPSLCDLKLCDWQLLSVIISSLRYFLLHTSPVTSYLLWPPVLVTFILHSGVRCIVPQITHLLVESVIQYPSLCLMDKVLGVSLTALCSNSPVETSPSKHTFLTLGLCFPQPLLQSLLPVTYWAPACPAGGLYEIITILDSGISQTLGHSLAL